MKINWKVRFNKYNKTFILRFIAALVIPVIAYMGLEVTDFTTWDAVKDALVGFISNPYLVVLTLINAINMIPDPTTGGISDSNQALTYKQPRKEDV